MSNITKPNHFVEVWVDSLAFNVSFDCEICILFQHKRSRGQTHQIPHPRSRGPVLFPPDPVRMAVTPEENGSVQISLTIQVSVQGRSKHGGSVSIKFPFDLSQKQNLRLPLEQCPDPNARVDLQISCLRTPEISARRADSLHFTSGNRLNVSHSPSTNVKIAFSKTNILNKTDQFFPATNEAPKTSTNIYGRPSASKLNHDDSASVSSCAPAKTKTDLFQDLKLNQTLNFFNTAPTGSTSQSHQNSLKTRIFQHNLTNSLNANSRNGSEAPRMLSVSSTKTNPTSGLENRHLVKQISNTKSRNFFVSFNDQKEVQPTPISGVSSPEMILKERSSNSIRNLLSQKKNSVLITPITNLVAPARLSSSALSDLNALKSFDASTKKKKESLKLVDNRAIFVKFSTSEKENMKALEIQKDFYENQLLSKSSEYTTKLNDVENEKVKLEGSLSFAMSEIKRLTEEVELASRIREIDSESSKNEKLRFSFEIQELQNNWKVEKEVLSKELEGLRSELSQVTFDQQSTKSAFEELVVEKDFFKADCLRINEILRQSQISNSELEAIISKMSAQHISELNELREQISELRPTNEFTPVHTISEVIIEDDTKIKELSKMIESLEGQISSEKSISSSLNVSMNQLKAELERLTEKVESLTKALASQTEEGEIMSGEIERSVKRLKIMEAKNIEYERSLRDKELKESKMTSQIIEMHQEIHRFNGLLSDSETAFKLVQEEQMTYQTKYHELLQTVDITVNSLKNSSIKHDVKQKLLEVLTASLIA